MPSNFIVTSIYCLLICMKMAYQKSPYFFIIITTHMEASGLKVKCPHLWIKQSRFEPWLRTLCCVLWLGTWLSQYLIPLTSRCINHRVPVNLMLGSITLCWAKEGVEIFLGSSWSCYRNWDKLHLACMQTYGNLPYIAIF